MNNIKKFSSRKEVTEFLATKGIDTSNWSEEKWLQINKSQADIHIQAIAELMWDDYNESIPKQLQPGEWHIPDFGMNKGLLEKYISDHYLDSPKTELKVSVAHCARISYQTLGDNPKIDYEADIRLHDRLLKDEHMSPFEHIAKAEVGQFANFTNFKSYRYEIEG